MIRDIDILRSANELIAHHRDEARIVTTILADALLEKGSIEGQRV